MITWVLQQSRRADDAAASTSILLKPSKDAVLACAQEGHCHEEAMLREDAADMDGGDDRLPAVASTVPPVKKREARASFLTMAAGAGAGASHLSRITEIELMGSLLKGKDRTRWMVVCL